MYRPNISNSQTNTLGFTGKPLIKIEKPNEVYSATPNNILITPKAPSNFNAIKNLSPFPILSNIELNKSNFNIIPSSPSQINSESFNYREPEFIETDFTTPLMSTQKMPIRAPPPSYVRNVRSYDNSNLVSLGKRPYSANEACGLTDNLNLSATNNKGIQQQYHNFTAESSLDSLMSKCLAMNKFNTSKPVHSAPFINIAPKPFLKQEKIVPVIKPVITTSSLSTPQSTSSLNSSFKNNFVVVNGNSKYITILPKTTSNILNSSMINYSQKLLTQANGKSIIIPNRSSLSATTPSSSIISALVPDSHHRQNVSTFNAQSMTLPNSMHQYPNSMHSLYKTNNINIIDNNSPLNLSAKDGKSYGNEGCNGQKNVYRSFSSITSSSSYANDSMPLNLVSKRRCPSTEEPSTSLNATNLNMRSKITEEVLENNEMPESLTTKSSYDNFMNQSLNAIQFASSFISPKNSQMKEISSASSVLNSNATNIISNLNQCDVTGASIVNLKKEIDPVTTTKSESPKHKRKKINSSLVTPQKQVRPKVEDCYNIDFNFGRDGLVSPTFSPEKVSDADDVKFVWDDYLESCQAIAAPSALFKHVECSLQNGLKKGMVVEVANKNPPGTFWVSIIVMSCGQLLMLKPAGCHDDDSSLNFWCDMSNCDLRQIGWCRETGNVLCPPADLVDKIPKDWQPVLDKLIRESSTPSLQMLEQKTGSLPFDQIQIGMYFEVQHLFNPLCFWFASVVENVGGRLLLRFHGDQDCSDDFWLFYTDARLHPIGWIGGMEGGKMKIIPPKSLLDKYPMLDWSNMEKKCYEDALLNCPPPEVFKDQDAIEEHNFEEGQRLEMLDEMTSTFHVAHVTRVVNNQYFIVQSDVITCDKVMNDVTHEMEIEEENNETTNSVMESGCTDVEPVPSTSTLLCTSSYRLPSEPVTKSPNATTTVTFDATSTILNSTSATLNSTSTTLNLTSTILNSTSATLNSTSATLNSTSATLNSTSTTLNSTSATLNSTSTTLNSTSTTLNSTSATLNSTSPPSNVPSSDTASMRPKTSLPIVKCCHFASTNIFPINWCQENGFKLQAVPGYQPRSGEFDWNEYLKDISGTAASVDNFFQLVEDDVQFETGMKLEVVNQNKRSQLCAATVAQVQGHLLSIKFDHTPSISRILPCDSHEIFPIGWCESNNYPLKAPTKKSSPVPSVANFTGVSSEGDNNYDNVSLETKNSSGWCSKIYFNNTCYSGPYLSKSRLNMLPKSVGPGPIISVMTTVLTKLIGCAYKSSRVLREIQLEGQLKPNMHQQVLRTRYKLKNYSANVDICMHSSQLDAYCRDICKRLVCCPNLISTHLYPLGCPENCLKLARSKHYYHFGEKKRKIGRPRGGHSNIEGTTRNPATTTGTKETKTKKKKRHRKVGLTLRKKHGTLKRMLKSSTSGVDVGGGGAGGGSSDGGNSMECVYSADGSAASAFGDVTNGSTNASGCSAFTDIVVDDKKSSNFSVKDISYGSNDISSDHPGSKKLILNFRTASNPKVKEENSSSTTTNKKPQEIRRRLKLIFNQEQIGGDRSYIVCRGEDESSSSGCGEGGGGGGGYQSGESREAVNEDSCSSGGWSGRSKKRKTKSMGYEDDEDWIDEKKSKKKRNDSHVKNYDVKTRNKKIYAFEKKTHKKIYIIPPTPPATMAPEDNRNKMPTISPPACKPANKITNIHINANNEQSGKDGLKVTLSTCVKKISTKTTPPIIVKEAKEPSSLSSTSSEMTTSLTSLTTTLTTISTTNHSIENNASGYLNEKINYISKNQNKELKSVTNNNSGYGWDHINFTGHHIKQEDINRPTNTTDLIQRDDTKKHTSKNRRTSLKLASNPETWDVLDVVEYMKTTDCYQFARIFKEQEIDGRSMLLLDLQTIQSLIEPKLGPAVKLCDLIENIKKAYFKQFSSSITL